MKTMPRLLSACAGFLVAVLWFDLMFDAQAMPYLAGGAPVPEAVVASIAAYYRRVTLDAFPMGHLVGLVMLVTLAGCVYQLFRGEGRRLAHAAALLFAAGPIALGMLRVFPNAVRLGRGGLAPDVAAALALAILRDHLICIAGIFVFLAIALSTGAGEAAGRPGRRPAAG